MQEFIARENLKLYQRKLAETVDPGERERLTQLIDSERKRLRELTGSSPPDLA
jgi:hypothetical protein